MFDGCAPDFDGGHDFRGFPRFPGFLGFSKILKTMEIDRIPRIPKISKIPIVSRTSHRIGVAATVKIPQYDG